MAFLVGALVVLQQLAPVAAGVITFFLKQDCHNIGVDVVVPNYVHG
jgi:hypothetical protein